MRNFDRLNFLKNKKICMEKVARGQGLSLRQRFPYKSSKSTSFPGPFPWPEGGTGKDPGIGWSRVHLHPEILGVIN